ncbi:MAG TPA: iron-sulfur cluster assembly scaffold protein [Blastocatellia bacterium]|nr:iron-sulfur cluster assembly scaffold protein [Blastocatellia bacterium]
MYTAQVADHIANPRNIGDIENPSGVGDVVNEVCLDRIRLMVRVERGTLVDAKVRVSGCPPTIAAASVLTELIVGRRISELESLRAEDIESALGRLPAAKRHCAQLAMDALRVAIQNSADED